MPTSYTSLLGLALPVTGELSGTWGDTVNDYLTKYLDAAVAGAQTISGSQTAVTLTTTNGSTLTQAGSGATGSAQYQIINCTGNPASLLTITVPAQSKAYLVLNATSTSQSVKVVGAGPTTGVTMVSGEKALIAWDGSDFVKVASSTADGVTTLSFGTTGLTPNSATAGAITVAGTLATTNGGTGLTSFTANGVVYASSTSALTTGSALTFDGTNLSVGGTAPSNAGYTNLYLNNTSGAQLFLSVNGSNSRVLYSTATSLNYYTADASPHVWQISGSEVARLTSTGLGIGTSSPSRKLTIESSGAAFPSASNPSVRLNETSSGRFAVVELDSSQNLNIWNGDAGSGSIRFYRGAGSGTLSMTLDGSGNLGLGVTPSAWQSSSKAYELGSAGTGQASWQITSSGYMDIFRNAYIASGGTATYKYNGYAQQYRQDPNGIHSWSVAPSGTAGNAISFTQAMTLHASGGLSLGNTSDPGAGTLNVNGITVGRGAGGDSSNTVLGSNALVLNTTGYRNTALGQLALNANTTGFQNTAVGRALEANTTGNENTAVGRLAMFSNTTGGFNVAVGNEALRQNTTASNNTAVGYQAAYSNTTGTQSVAVGTQAFYSNSTGGYSTALGYRALYSNTIGDDNVAVGRNSLGSNTSGNQNVSIGGLSLVANTTGSFNTAIGLQTLRVNTTGSRNVAIGGESAGNTTSAMDQNTTGGANVAVGNGALRSNTIASYNTAVGYQALYSFNRTADSDTYNTAIGYYAGYSLTTGKNNTFIGTSAGQGGFGAGAFTTGEYNISIGFTTGASSGARNNSIVIGTPYAVVDKGENTGYINPNSGGVYQGNNSSSWSTTSDRRLKKNIVDNNEGLEKIAAIRVRNFEYRLPEEVDPELEAHCAVKREGVQLGVIAQELQEVCPDCVKQESTGVLSVDSDNVFWHMVNAIKQLKSELDTVKAELNTLKGA